MKQRIIVVMSIVLTVTMLLSGAGAVLAAPTGTGPDDAWTPTSEWQALEAGEEHWFAFQYTGDGSQVQIEMQVAPEGSASFAVWTPEEIQRWRLGLEANPVGRGSADRSGRAVLSWSGSFSTPGTYYVVVEPEGNQPAESFYLLQVSGDGVSTTTSEPAPPSAKSEPAKTPARAATPAKMAGKLVFQTTTGGDFYTINVDGRNLQRITDGIDPVWSPDSTQIAFTRWRDPRGVWVVNADGSGEQRVFDWDQARWPSWSPDGAQIVFSRRQGGREEDIEKCFRGRCFTIPAKPQWKLGIVDPTSGSFAEPLPNSDVSLAPDWSPDGQKVVFDAEQGLMVQSVDGQTAYQLTDGAQDTSPVWSPAGAPNGEQIAFVRRQHDHWEIYAVNADGSGLTRLTTTPQRPDGVPGSSAAPAWSPEGQYIAFYTDRTGEWEIWVMKADGSGQKPMFGSELDGLTLDYRFEGERAISWTK